MGAAALGAEDATSDTDTDGPVVELVNVLVKDHSDATEQTEAIWLGEDVLALIDSATIVGNGGAPLVAENDDFELTVLNTILWDNGLGPFASFDGSFARACSNSQPSQSGSRFFGSGVDPEFVTTPRGPYRLDPAGSPLIDTCGTGPSLDLEGGGRPGRQRWDPGAFEVDPVPPLFRDAFETGDTSAWSSP